MAPLYVTLSSGNTASLLFLHACSRKQIHEKMPWEAKGPSELNTYSDQIKLIWLALEWM